MRLGIGRVGACALALVCASAHAGFEISPDAIPAPTPASPRAAKASVTAKGKEHDAPVQTFAVTPSASDKTVAATKAAAAPAPVQKPRWDVRSSDVTIRKTLLRWAKGAKPRWQVSWEARIDHPVQVEATFTGDFESAVQQMMQALRNTDAPLMACLYEGNRVVRVLRYGDIEDCNK